MQFDIFHNEYFNYTKQDDFQIVIPSTFYKFDDKTPEVDAVAFEHDQVLLESFPRTNCIINTSSSRQLINVLKLIQKIQKCMHLFTSSFVITGKPTGPGVRFDGFMNRDILTTLIKSTVRFHDDTKKVAVAFCYLSQPAFHHIVRQLRHCHQMEDFRFCFIEQMIPLDLGKSLCRMQSLRNVEIEGCYMTKEVCNKLLLGISTCLQLQKLNLSYSALTNPLKTLFGSSSQAGLQNLEVLQIVATKITREDICSLANAVRHRRLPNLRHLDLSENCLKGNLRNLMFRDGNENPRYLLLEQFYLRSTELNKVDIDDLCQAIHWNHFPRLNMFDISNNNLTNSVGHLLSQGNCLKLPHLEVLRLAFTQLSARDLRDVGKAIGCLSRLKALGLAGNAVNGRLADVFSSGTCSKITSLNLSQTQLTEADIVFLTNMITERKLPRISHVNLRENDFRGMENLLEGLVKICAKHCKGREMNISLCSSNVSNPDSIIEKLKALCDRTTISISWRSISASEGVQFSTHHSFTLQPGLNFFSIPLRL